MLFRAKAPLRVSFAGGGTDVPPYPDLEGGLVLNATINRYAYGALTPRADRRISIESVDYDMTLAFDLDDPLTFDGELDLIKAAIRKIGSRSAGFDLLVHANAPPGSGLGSSSAVMVTLIALLREFHRLPLTDYETAALAYTIERRDLGIIGGAQDQYSATFGGFNYLEFAADRVTVNPLRVPENVVHELEHNLLLYFTGRPRADQHVIVDQMERYAARDQGAVEGLRMQKEIATHMKNALLRRQLDEFGELLGLAWKYKQQMSPFISTESIADACEVARVHGALGGKVTGAGGGGYVLFYCPFRKKHRVADALLKLGGQVTEFEFTHQGVTTWCLPT